MGELPGSIFRQVQAPHVARLQHFWPPSDHESPVFEYVFPGFNQTACLLFAAQPPCLQTQQILGLL